MNVFNDIIADDEFFSSIPDCIFEAADYEEYFEQAFVLTNGLLTLENFETQQTEDQFEYIVTVNGREENFTIDIQSDYVNSADLVKALNQILQNNSYAGPKHFCDLDGGVIDFGIAFITPEKEAALADAKLIFRNNGEAL